MAERKIILEGIYPSDLTKEHIRERVMRIIENSDRFQTKTPPVIEMNSVGEDKIRFTAYEEIMEPESKEEIATTKKQEKKSTLTLEIQEAEKRVEGAKQALQMVENDIDLGIISVSSGELDFAIQSLRHETENLENLKRIKNENPDLYIEEEKEIKSIQDSFEELKKMREELSRIEKSTDREKLIQLLEEKVDAIETEVYGSEEISESLKKELQEVEEEIASYQKSMKEQVKEYEECYQKMEKMIDQKKEELSNSNFLTEKEKKNFEQKYKAQEEEINQESVKIKQRIEEQKESIVQLQEKRKKLEENIVFVEAFQLSVKEFNEITKAMSNDEEMIPFVSDIYASLEDVILKKPEEKTKEDVQKLKEAKEKILIRIRGEEKVQSVVDVIDKLHFTEDAMHSDGYMTMTLTEEEIDQIIRSTSILPEKIVKSKKEPDYVPHKAPEDMESVLESQLDESTIVDSITIFRDEEGNTYVRKSVLDRFHIDETNPIENQEGKLYAIQKEDYEFILSAAHNSYSPYFVEEKEFIKQDSQSKEEPQEDVKPIEEPIVKNNSAADKMVFYYEEENDVYYAKQPVLRRFSLEPVGNPISVEGVEYYPLALDDADYIRGNAGNSYSPYEVEVRSYHKEKVEEKPSKKIPVTAIVVTLYQDLNHENQAYVTDSVLRKFKIEQSGTPIMIGKQKCYPISLAMEERIGKVADKSTTPKIVLNYVPIKTRKKETRQEASMESREILERLTKDLMIQEDDAQFYVASNIQVTKKFKEELQEGNHSYNIIHTIPGIIKAGITFLNKLVSKLILGKRGKEAMKEFNRRLNHELTEEECNVLLQDYANHSFDQTSQKYMNELVIERLEKHAKSKLLDFNEKIENSYTVLYVTLKEIEALETKDNRFQTEQKRLKQKVMGILQSMEENQMEAKKLCIDGFDLEKDILKLPYLNRPVPKFEELQCSQIAKQLDYQEDSFVEEYFQEIVVSSHQMSLQVKEGIQNLDQDSLKDFGLDYWPFQDSYRILDDEEETFYNSFQEEVNRSIESIMSEYISRQISKEEAIEGLSNVARSSQSALVEVSNESMKQMKPYAAMHSEFDLSALEEAMEYIVAHPNAMVDDTLSTEYQEALSQLPKEMLSTIICSATATSFAIETAVQMEEKQKKSITSKDVSDMIDNYMKEKEENGKKKR